MSLDDRQRTGTMRVYLGAAPGVGKTCAMLSEGRRRRDRGADVVVGYVETHGRAFTAAQLDDLEVVPRRVLVHRDVQFEEMDLEAVIARAPRVVLIDELAHTNVPGSTHEKRWQDIDTILAAGIDVISTVNIQHLESMNDVVERITGIRQLETVPDAFVRRADQIELVDMTPEALRRRLAHGNVYAPQKVDAALANYFRPGNLAALRELALLWVADRVEDGLRKYMALHDIDHSWETRERVVVAITGAPDGDHVIRRAARMAGRSAGELLGVFVSASDGLARRAGPNLDAQRRLLDELGGRYLEVVGDDVAMALVGTARAERATQLVLGASRRSSVRDRLGGSIVAAVLRAAGELDVHVISSADEMSEPSPHRLFPHRGRVSTRRHLAGAAMAVIGLPLLTAVLDSGRDVIELPSVLLVYLVAVIAIATIGGTVIGLGSALAAFALANFYFIEPTGTLLIDDPDHFVALVVFLTAAVTVSTIVGVATRRSDEAHRARAEAEALARSSASLVTEADPVPAVLEHLRLALGAAAARLETRSGDTWQVAAAAGVQPALSRADSGDDGPRPVVVDLDATNRLIVIGTALNADDRRLVGSFGNQLVAGLRTRDSKHDADRAERLTAVDELRTGLLRAVSHDLRTPLATIKASVSGLLSEDVEWPEAERTELLHAIDDETDRLDQIIGNLLDMSRLEAGVLAARRAPVAVDDVVAAALASLTGVESGSVIVSIDPELPQVVADAALLERAVANLVSNAVTASCGHCPVRVEAGLVSTDRLDVRIVDRGPGLPEEDRIRLFEPFQRLDDRGGPKGLGLGLAIARRFIDSMGGELVLDDTPGGGVTATIRLQVAR
jgi:two-component system, OmpR family, sensor histidine kinase KdpD